MKPASLGVDMIETHKAKTLFQNCRPHLAYFLTPREQNQIHHSQKPDEMFAIMLAAKEAIFKTQQLPWMGLSGFQAIEIEFPEPQKGQARFCNNSGKTLEFYYKKEKRYIVVWSMS